MSNRLALVLAALALAALIPSPGKAAGRSEVVATYPHGGQISARGSVLAVARISDDDATARLLVGTGSAAPVPAADVGPLPRWAIPHVGTDASGATVVTYPRCASAAVSSCDLYAYDVAASAEVKLGGVSAAKVGETEGVFDRGALAFSRWVGSKQPKALVDGTQVFARTALHFKPAKGTVRMLAVRGGQQLALRGRWIAHVYDATNRTSGGICGVSAVQLVRTDGKFARQVRETTCGENGSRSTGPSFAGNSLVFGSSMNGDDGIVFRFDLGSHRTFQGRGPGGFVGFAATKTNAAWVMRQNGDGAPWTLERFTGLAPTSTKSV